MERVFELTEVTKFKDVDWSLLSPGQSVYYWIKYKDRKSPKREDAHGPFTVVDPSQRRLRNQQGVEINFGNNIQPMIKV